MTYLCYIVLTDTDDLRVTRHLRLTVEVRFSLVGHVTSLGQRMEVDAISMDTVGTADYHLVLILAQLDSKRGLSVRLQ